MQAGARVLYRWRLRDGRAPLFLEPVVDYLL